MTALPLPPPRAGLRLLPTPGTQAPRATLPTAVVTPSQARAWVVEALRLVAFTIDAGATPTAEREAKDEVLRTLVEQLTAQADTAPEAVAAALEVADVDTSLAAERLVATLSPQLTAQDRTTVQRALADTEWPSGLRWTLAPGVALAYGARLLDEDATADRLTALRRRRLVHRAVARATSTPVPAARPEVAADPAPQPTYRRATDPVVPGVLYVPLAAQFAAERAAGRNPFTVLPSPGSAAAS